jgi:hypothetical protein
MGEMTGEHHQTKAPVLGIGPPVLNSTSEKNSHPEIHLTGGSSLAHVFTSNGWISLN